MGVWGARVGETAQSKLSGTTPPNCRWIRASWIRARVAQCLLRPPAQNVACQKGVEQVVSTIPRQMRRHLVAGFFKIVARPQGEAPEWVREAWIGIVLPQFQGNTLGTSFGVLSRKAVEMVQERERYLARVELAVAILGETSYDAANWWRISAYRLFEAPDQLFSFDSLDCILL